MARKLKPKGTRPDISREERETIREGQQRMAGAEVRTDKAGATSIGDVKAAPQTSAARLAEIHARADMAKSGQEDFGTKSRAKKAVSGLKTKPRDVTPEEAAKNKETRRRLKAVSSAYEKDTPDPSRLTESLGSFVSRTGREERAESAAKSGAEARPSRTPKARRGAPTNPNMAALLGEASEAAAPRTRTAAPKSQKYDPRNVMHNIMVGHTNTYIREASKGPRANRAVLEAQRAGYWDTRNAVEAHSGRPEEVQGLQGPCQGLGCVKQHATGGTHCGGGACEVPDPTIRQRRDVGF